MFALTETLTTPKLPTPVDIEGPFSKFLVELKEGVLRLAYLEGVRDGFLVAVIGCLALYLILNIIKK